MPWCSQTGFSRSSEGRGPASSAAVALSHPGLAPACRLSLGLPGVPVGRQWQTRILLRHSVKSVCSAPPGASHVTREPHAGLIQVHHPPPPPLWAAERGWGRGGHPAGAGEADEALTPVSRPPSETWQAGAVSPCRGLFPDG